MDILPSGDFELPAVEYECRLLWRRIAALSNPTTRPPFDTWKRFEGFYQRFYRRGLSLLKNHEELADLEPEDRVERAAGRLTKFQCSTIVDLITCQMEETLRITSNVVTDAIQTIRDIDADNPDYSAAIRVAAWRSLTDNFRAACAQATHAIRQSRLYWLVNDRGNLCIGTYHCLRCTDPKKKNHEAYPHGAIITLSGDVLPYEGHPEVFERL